MPTLVLVALAVFALNLPFGYWRAGVRKFSAAWFFAVHLPVPGVVALRLLSGLGFELITYPVLASSPAAGCTGGAGGRAPPGS